MAMPPLAVCDRARQTKDARFDGLFYTGVRSTRIFCRPVCPAPTPKPHNIVYFPSAAAAGAAGYRPCFRCRPELAPEIKPRDQTVQRALVLIAEGALDEGSIEALASRLAVSPRHLRRLFADHVGATPMQFHQARRIALAKQLLTETAMPITQVALAAGFASVRRFNDAFLARCGRSPSAARRYPARPHAGDIELRLAYRPPFDFNATLAVLRRSALPGIELVDDESYQRNVASGREASWIRVVASCRKPELHLRAVGVRAQDMQPLVRRVRRMFDLDADLHSAHDALGRDSLLAESISRRPGLRIPGAWSGFELAIALLLEEGDAGLAAARIIRQLIDRYGSKVDGAPAGLERKFPDASTLAAADIETLLCASARSARAVRGLALAVRDERLHFGPGQLVDDFAERFVACTDCGSSVAYRIACRALGDPDVWPIAADEAASHEAMNLSSRAMSWRPWRSYGALHAGRLVGPHAAFAAVAARSASVESAESGATHDTAAAA